MIHDTLTSIQNQLKAPKGQYNSFGKYAYRSCEDILEALKPVLANHKASVTLSDEIVMMGDRFYIKATATLFVGEESCFVTAYAREDADKKGMDGSQITGAASSYARKYALNGLFAIDDTKDADTAPPSTSKSKSNKITAEPKEYKCCDCGKEFIDAPTKSGQMKTAGEWYHIAESYSPDGKARCGQCAKKVAGNA